MGREEQAEEREVLDSIFPDEITDLSQDSFRVTIALDVQQEDDDDTPTPTILLTISLPESYPDTAPNLSLSSPPNAPKHPFLDLSDDSATLLSSLDEPTSSSLGTQMIFTLISTLKDSAELLISERQKAQVALKEVERSKVEEAENVKFQGEAVTRESFLRWREEWRREVEGDERKKEEEREMERKKAAGRGGGGREERLTGRQLWERGLVGKEEEEAEEDEETEAVEVEERIGGLKVEG
ncbi:MAG: hypothetical protein LQ340_002967 [Diploschistes diacapsis]|nr:MAG: hypothetical protein LQ340_002967 [Diploschistes diacapsis]